MEWKKLKKALLEAEEKDESIIEARKLAGFKLETKLLSATELQTTTSFEFSSSGCQEGFSVRIFEEYWLRKSFEE